MAQSSDDSGFRQASREVTPAFTLNKVGQYSLHLAEASEEGRELNIITALLMCALSMEAVLNHAGARAFVDVAREPRVWDAIERLGPKDKLEAIAERCCLPLDFSMPPFQHFGAMFQFRNDLVHAKTTTHTSDRAPAGMKDSDEIVDNVPDLQARWEQYRTIDMAKMWRKSVYEMSDTLCEAAGCLNPVLVGDLTTWNG